jgi:TRAP-type mannitol/chloroaromatic compound transport system permease small subunit
MNTLARVIERLSALCGALAALAVLALIAVTMIEVLSRYVFRSPTLWAFDVAYMLNGTAFILACALALRQNQHVSIDILSQYFSGPLRRRVEVVVFALLVFPVLGFLCYSAWGQAWKAFVTGEIEEVSPWRPKIWPFQLVLAIGLTALWLQVFGRIVRSPSPDEPARRADVR